MFAKAHVEEGPKRDGLYMGIAKQAVAYPKTVLLLAVRHPWSACSTAIRNMAPGSNSSPMSSPNTGRMYVSARGNLSLQEMNRATAQAEERFLGWPGVSSIFYTPRRSVARRWPGHCRGRCRHHPSTSSSTGVSASLLAVPRRPARRQCDIPGVEVEVRVPEAGPPTGQASRFASRRSDPAGLVIRAAQSRPGLPRYLVLIDIADGLPPPGVDWAIRVDRAKASQYGISPGWSAPWCSLSPNGSSCPITVPRASTIPSTSVAACPMTGHSSPPLDELAVQTSMGGAALHFRDREPERRSAPSTIYGGDTIIVSAIIARASRLRPSRRGPPGCQENRLGRTRFRLACSVGSDEAVPFLAGACGSAYS